MPLTVLYDANCLFCRASARLLRRLDRRGECVFLDGTRPESGARLPAPVTPQDLRQALHVVDADGRVYRGFDAVHRLLRLNPWTRVLAAALLLPGVHSVGHRAYTVIARYRHRLPRGT